MIRSTKPRFMPGAEDPLASRTSVRGAVGTEVSASGGGATKTSLSAQTESVSSKSMHAVLVSGWTSRGVVSLDDRQDRRGLLRDQRIGDGGLRRLIGGDRDRVADDRPSPLEAGG